MDVSNISSPTKSTTTFYWEKDGETLCSTEYCSVYRPPQVGSIQSPECIPDGELQAWIVVLGGFCCMVCSFGWINCELQKFLTFEVANMA